MKLNHMMIALSAVFTPATLAAAPYNAMASYYYHGHTTANGERFNPDGLTAAHKTLPFGTKVKVTNLSNQKQVVVRINDRGPFIRGREIDLSRGAARKIGMINSGVTRVQLEVL